MKLVERSRTAWCTQSRTARNGHMGLGGSVAVGIAEADVYPLAKLAWQWKITIVYENLGKPAIKGRCFIDRLAYQRVHLIKGNT